MPTRDYETDAFAYSSNYDVKQIKAQADRLACVATNLMECLMKADPTLTGVEQDTRKWYAKHQKADQTRKSYEAKILEKKKAELKLRKDALSKLTPEEIKAFGIKV